MNEKKLNLIYAGLMSYNDALQLQLKTQQQRKENLVEDTLIFVEHPPVLTTGRRDQSHNILVDPDEVGAELIKTTRGGEVTYHGPGQLVGYVILDLDIYKKGIKGFVTDLEEVFITLLKQTYNIESYRDKKHRGVWVEDAKITAVGLAVNHGITMHGFAFNVNPDLSHFDWIVPCGIQGKAVTSLEKITGQKQNLDLVTKQVLESFKTVFNYQ